MSALDRIGPYRVLRSLGAGGMGEVFLAWDERLEREVAIKRIRSELGAPAAPAVSADSRERFRREARLAARLNHPAIVQVYDVLAEGDDDAIVMEYVAGTTLRRLLDHGPLPAAVALRILRDVAQGLEAAHAQGIVHRDLKTENVLVTAGGAAKIADFGIAKRLDETRADNPLTATGKVLGTCRAMSPEQARGEAVDFRSDLFSLGVLFYETLTGASPFEGDNELATLSRVIALRQSPADRVNPSVSGELSSLVEQLLQKDPLLRPRSAGEVARTLEALVGSAGRTAVEGETIQEIPRLAAARAHTGRGWRYAFWLAPVVLAGAAAVSYLALRPPPPPLTVAVLAPEIERGAERDEIQLLASGVRVALAQGLLGLQGVSPRDADEALGTSGPPAAIAKAAAVEELVRTRLVCGAEACKISLARLAGKDGALLWSQSFDVPTDDFHLVAAAVTNQIRRAYAGHPVRRGVRTLGASDRDFREFLRLRRRFEERSDPSFESVLAGLAEIRSRAPNFLAAYLLEANALRYRFYTSRDPADLERATELITRARSLSPDDPQPLFVLIEVAAAANQPNDIAKAVRELERLLPGDVRLMDGRARLLQVQGKSAEALAVLRAAARQQPSVKRLFNLAQQEMQAGEIPAARLHAEQLLARSPDHPDGLFLLATIELFNGDLEKAAALYRRLIARSPGLEALSGLALAHFFSGRYSDAARTFGELLEREPSNPLVTLNLADSYLLLGRKPEAEDLYQRVVSLIEADPAARTPQFLTAKAQALSHLGRDREAAAAVQEALQLAPNDGPIAFEAAVVYALLGETASSLVSAEKALALGTQERWFEIPWLEPLRSHPDFRRLMDRKAVSE